MSRSGGETSPSGHEAIRKLHAEHGRSIRAYFERRCGDREEASELTQETFLRALEGWRGFRGEAPAEHWLRSIATRVFQDSRRRAGRQKREGTELPLDALAAEPAEAAAEAGEPPALRRALRREERALVHTAIDALPERMGVAIKLYVCQERKQRRA